MRLRNSSLAASSKRRDASRLHRHGKAHHHHPPMPDLYTTARRAFNSLFTSTQRFPLWLIPPLLLFDGALTSLVILKVPYTEIDWTAYMEQVTQYLAGERDYS